MVTSRMSYSLHCDIGRTRDCGSTKLTVREDDIPTLYVAVASWIPKCNMYNVDSDVQEKTRNEEVNTTEVLQTVENIPQEIKPNTPEKDVGTKSPSKDTLKKDVQTKSPSKDTLKKDDELDLSRNELDTTQEDDDLSNDEDSPSKDDKEEDVSIISVENITPKKDSQDGQKERSSSRKKLPEKLQKAKEERERKRQEEKEARETLKREKLEQKIKERQEKEEQRKKERVEKEEQRRKEKEEKEEQKRKEKEEKEALRIKEKEEKEAQKIKEREEKEEQKRKEKEEKELKKQQELDKEKKKMVKESAAFVNFFVPRKSTGAIEPKKTEEVISYFMPFQIKADMKIAPSQRRALSTPQKDKLTDKITSQAETKLYLTEIKTKKFGKDYKTWPVEDDDVVLLDDTGLGECLEEQPIKNVRMRAKFLFFHENRRPAYFGTFRKTSKTVTPRKPLGVDKDAFDYEVDSDDDWEEEEPGESLKGSDDEEKENDSDEYEVDNDFFVPHGYLSDEEAENEEHMELTPETQKEKLKILQMEFEQEMKSKTERIKPRLIGCIWENKLKPKIQDAITSFLEERMMIISAPIIIKKRDNKENTSSKNSTPTRKQLSKELIPDFLRMIHGSTNNKIYLVNEFLNFLSNQHSEVRISKSVLTSQLKEYATWKKCPDEGTMFNKHCWYVHEDVRKQLNLNLILPNEWAFSEEINAKKKLNL